MTVSVPRIFVAMKAAEGFILCDETLAQLQATFARHIADTDLQLHARESAAKGPARPRWRPGMPGKR